MSQGKGRAKSGKRVRTALDREVDQELISKGKDVVKDFDESQAFYVPAKGRGRLERAFRFAASVHRDQKRKGSEIPYITHLMAVSAIVEENGMVLPFINQRTLCSYADGVLDDL